MANTDFTSIEQINTFDQWRVTTNALITDRNTLRNRAYVKDNGSFILSNGSVVLTNGSITVSNSVTGNVIVGRDLTVGNTVFTSNLVFTGSISGPGYSGGGAQGAPGAQGATGAGSPGPQGATGSPGAQGATGAGSPGPQGAQGAPGGGGSSVTIKDEGSTLTTGVTSIDFVGAGVQATTVGNDVTVTISGGGGGAQGATGSPGPQGAAGSPGPQGAAGSPGPQGASGSPGAQGATGSGGTITNNNSSSSDYYPLLTTATSGTLSGVTVSATKLTFVPSTGILTATDFAATSDKDLKNVIGKVENAVEKLKNVSGVEFYWNDKAKNIGVSDSNDLQVGVLAQEVEKLYPSMVHLHNDGYKRVNYDKLIPLLLEAIKELSARVKVLEGK